MEDQVFEQAEDLRMEFMIGFTNWVHAMLNGRPEEEQGKHLERAQRASRQAKAIGYRFFYETDEFGYISFCESVALTR